MGTTQADIKRWLEKAKRDGASHVIIATDTFDWSDYPVPVKHAEKVNAEIARLSNPNNMQRVMEVYDLSLPIEPQLREQRAWHIPVKGKKP